MGDAAANGHFEVVKWLHANMKETVGNLCTDKAYESATCNGHFELMKWLSAHYGRRHEMTIADDAASHGRLNALKWMRSVGSGHITERAMDEASANGHLEVVKWLHAHNNGCTTAAMNGAAKNGYLAVVKWLHDNRHEGCTTDAMVDAASNGHLDVVCWLHDHRTQSFTAETIKRAAANGHLEVVRWLYKELGNQFSLVDLMNSAAVAAIGGHLKVVQVLATKSQFSDPKYLTPLMANAFKYGRVAIVEWLLGLGYQVRAKDTIWVQESRSWGTAKPETMQIIYKGSEVSVPDVRRFIVRRRDIRMARWLWCHGCNLHTFKDLHRAVGCNNIVLTRWLIENGVRFDRDATWTNFWYDDYLEVVEWVPESDRVWVVREALATNEED
ncbi:hypothetical protein PR001_g28030 [Phytophthora rubi]|uniref:Ankyrin repeat-containing domain n=1 Tax=Phytophthora rubi TaxID=129364 RepID=A0A6A3HFM4_9STRA|nr:hypothetical protein PR002_g28092 [Phytophthora rubi]KAE8967675.1 hypothetical protein PR001_g28030 [Phytophthora rubi]